MPFFARQGEASRSQRRHKRADIEFERRQRFLAPEIREAGLGEAFVEFVRVLTQNKIVTIVTLLLLFMTTTAFAADPSVKSAFSLSSGLFKMMSALFTALRWGVKKKNGATQSQISQLLARMTQAGSHITTPQEKQDYQNAVLAANEQARLLQMQLQNAQADEVISDFGQNLTYGALLIVGILFIAIVLLMFLTRLIQFEGRKAQKRKVTLEPSEYDELDEQEEPEDQESDLEGEGLDDEQARDDPRYMTPKQKKLLYKHQADLMMKDPTYLSVLARLESLAVPDAHQYETMQLLIDRENAALLAVASAFGGLIAQIIIGSINYIQRVAETLFAIYPYLVFTATVSALMNAFINYTDTIVATVREVYQCSMRITMIDFITLPVWAMVLIGFLLVYGVVIFVARLLNIITWGPVRVLLTFVFAGYSVYATSLGNAVSAFVFSLVAWLQIGPLVQNWPIVQWATPLFQFVSEFFTGAVVPSCIYLNYILGGFGQGFLEPSLPLAVHSIGNIPIVTVQQLLFQPLFYQQRPLIAPFNNLTISALVNTAYWLQNITVIQSDITFGGNITAKVNGSQPMPTDGSEYFIRLLQSNWAEIFAYGFATVASVVYELMQIIIYPEQWFNLDGMSFWTFELIRQPLISMIDSMGTVVNVLPQCIVESIPEYNQSANIQFGLILTGALRTIVAVIFVLKDLFVGEIYTLIQGYPPTRFSAVYFISDGPMLQELKYQINQFALGFSCMFGLLLPEEALFVKGVINILFYYVVLIPIELFSVARFALEQGDSSIFNDLDTGPDAILNQFRLEAANLPNAAAFLYVLENSNTVICNSRLSFFCGAGKVVESSIRLLTQAFDLLIQVIINILRAFVNLVTEGEIGEVKDLNISLFVATAYTFGCRLGTTIANIIPITTPCLSQYPNLCRATPFNPVPDPQNPTICLSTFLCRLGQWIGAFFDVAATLLQFGNNILWGISSVTGGNNSFSSASNRALVTVLRQFTYILVYKILSPLCPAAHYFDCWLSVVSPSFGTPITSFVCLINSFLVRFIDIIGETVIKIVELLIYVITMIVGGQAAGGASVGGFVRVILLFFEIVGDLLRQIILALVGLLFQFLIPLFSFGCDVVCFFNSGSVCTDCRSFVNSLRGTATGFLNPNDDSNYAGVNARRAVEDLVERSANFTLAMRLAFGLTYRVRVPGPPGMDTYEEYNRTVTQESVPGHLARYVTWARNSRCGMLFGMMNHETTWSSLSRLEKLEINDCVYGKALHVVCSDRFPICRTLPEGTFYGMEAWFKIGFNFARFVVITIQYMSDRMTAPETVMGDTYINGFRGVGLNVTHYRNEFMNLWPGFNATQAEYMPWQQMVRNFSLNWYIDRNLPRLTSNGTIEFDGYNASADPLASFGDALWDTYNTANDWFWENLDATYQNQLALMNTTTMQAVTTGVDPANGQAITDESFFSQNAVFEYNNTMNSRSDTFRRGGDELTSLADTMVAFRGFYAQLIQIFHSLVEAVQQTKQVYGYGDQELDYLDTLNSANYDGTDTYVSGSHTYSPPPPPPPSSVPSTQETEPMVQTDSAPSSNQKRALKQQLADEQRLADAHYQFRVRPRIHKPIQKTPEMVLRAKQTRAKERTLIENERAEMKIEAKTRRMGPTTYEKVKRNVLENYAAGVDWFMQNTGVTAPEENNNNEKRDVHIHSQPPGKRILVAAVGAAASTFNLNTTYLPRWCTDPEYVKTHQDACNKTLWQHSIAMLSEGKMEGIGLQSVVNATFNAVSRVWNATFGPHDEKALNTRMFIYNAVSAIGQMATEVQQRFRVHYDEEGIPSAVDRIMQRFRGNSNGNPGGETLAEKLDMHRHDTPEQKARQKPHLRKVMLTEDQAKLFMEYYRQEHSSFMNEFFFSSGSSKNDTLFSEMRQPDSDWNHFIDQLTLVKPDIMRMALKNRRDPSQYNTKDNPRSLGKSMARVTVKFLNEENFIGADREAYNALFHPVDPLVGEISGRSNDMIGDVGLIHIKSDTNKRKFYEQATGKPAPAHSADLKNVDVRMYKRALFRKIPVSTANANAVAQINGYVGQQYAYEYVAGLHRWLKTETHEKLAEMQVSAMSTNTPIVEFNNVVEVKFKASDNEKAANQRAARINKFSSSSSSNNNNNNFETDPVKAVWYFPTSLEQTDDVARRILGCGLGNVQFCEQCPGGDYIVSKGFDRVLTLSAYYSKYFGPAYLTTAEFLSYTYNLNQTTRTGNGEYPPWYPALGIPAPYFYRGIEREIQDFPHTGPYWNFFFEDAIGAPLPTSLIYNGSYNTAYEMWKDAGAPTSSSEASFTVFTIYQWIEDLLGWNLPALFDTITDYAEEHAMDLAAYVFNSVRCNWRGHIDCTTRTFSFAGGYILIAESYFYLYTALTVLISPITGFTALSTLLPITPYIHAVITYGGSFGCFPYLPQCYLKDAFDLAAYSILNKCPVGIGTYVSSANYNANTCTYCENGPGRTLYNSTINQATFTYVNCYDYGFKNAYDGFQVLQWYNQQYGLANPWIFELGLWLNNIVYYILESLFGSEYGRPNFSRDWTNPLVTMNFQQSEIAYRNLWGCAIPTAVEGTSTAVFKSLILYATLAPAVLSFAPLLIYLLWLGVAMISLLLVAPQSIAMRVNLFYAQFLYANQLRPSKMRKTIWGAHVRKLEAEEFDKTQAEDALAGEFDDDDVDKYNLDDDDNDAPVPPSRRLPFRSSDMHRDPKTWRERSSNYAKRATNILVGASHRIFDATVGPTRKRKD